MPPDLTRIQRTKATAERFNELRPQKNTSQIDPQLQQDLDEIATGEIIEYTTQDPDEATALRRSLGRLAGSRCQMKLDFAGEGTTVIVKRSDRPYVPPRPV